METLLSGLFLLNRNISIYGLMCSRLPTSPPFSSCQWQAFCFMQGCDANNNVLSPHLCSFALILKEFFPPHSAIYGLVSFGSTKNVLPPAPFNVLSFTSTTCRVLSIQTVQNITAYSINSDKTVLRVWIKSPLCLCCSMAGWTCFRFENQPGSLTPCKQLQEHTLTSIPNSRRPRELTEVRVSWPHPHRIHAHLCYWSSGAQVLTHHVFLWVLTWIPFSFLTFIEVRCMQNCVQIMRVQCSEFSQTAYTWASSWSSDQGRALTAPLRGPPRSAGVSALLTPPAPSPPHHCTDV